MCCNRDRCTASCLSAQSCESASLATPVWCSVVVDCAFAPKKSALTKKINIPSLGTHRTLLLVYSSFISCIRPFGLNKAWVCLCVPFRQTPWIALSLSVTPAMPWVLDSSPGTNSETWPAHFCSRLSSHPLTRSDDQKHPPKHTKPWPIRGPTNKTERGECKTVKTQQQPGSVSFQISPCPSSSEDAENCLDLLRTQITCIGLRSLCGKILEIVERRILSKRSNIRDYTTAGERTLSGTLFYLDCIDDHFLFLVCPLWVSFTSIWQL